MLKAVRFDEEKHQHLLDFISNYIDTKDRKNESEGIRYLMQLGLDSLQQNTNINQTHVDTAKLKSEIFNDIMEQLNSQTLNGLASVIEKLENFKPVYIQQSMVNDNESYDYEVKQIPQSTNKKNIDIPVDTDPLLANILANANR